LKEHLYARRDDWSVLPVNLYQRKGKEVIQKMVLSDYKWWCYTKNKHCIRFAVCLL